VTNGTYYIAVSEITSSAHPLMPGGERVTLPQHVFVDLNYESDDPELQPEEGENSIYNQGLRP
jgi:hypothetical protein